MATSQGLIQPTAPELREAFEAGFDAIDRGATFYDGFEPFLRALGYQRRDDIPCTCPDQGWHGHMPECRWVRLG